MVKSLKQAARKYEKSYGKIVKVERHPSTKHKGQMARVHFAGGGRATFAKGAYGQWGRWATGLEGGSFSHRLPGEKPRLFWEKMGKKHQIGSKGKGTGKGRGWHGDPAGHAVARKKGGKRK